MAPIFCCDLIAPYRPRILDHEPKFNTFLQWARSSEAEGSTASNLIDSRTEKSGYAIQLVQQVNFGAIDSTRYFALLNSMSGDDHFQEVEEDCLVQANFEKLNTYKNFRCSRHNKFFELNVYQKNPTNAHHWRINVARPSAAIDLPAPRANIESKTSIERLSTTTSNNEITPLTLSLAISSLGSDFNGDLLSLLMLDILKAELNLNIDLVSAWSKLLTPKSVAEFIIYCGKGYEISTTTGEQHLMNMLENMAVSASIRHDDIPSRSSLEWLLRDVVTQLDCREGWKQTLRPGNITFSDHLDNHARAEMAALSQKALDITCNGLSVKFRVDSCRDLTGLRNSDNPQQDQVGNPYGRFSDAKAPNAELRIPFDMDDSDGDQDDREDLEDKFSYNDSGRNSIQDFTACSLEDCGYCGHCDY